MATGGCARTQVRHRDGVLRTKGTDVPPDPQPHKTMDLTYALTERASLAFCTRAHAEHWAAWESKRTGTQIPVIRTPVDTTLAGCVHCAHCGTLLHEPDRCLEHDACPSDRYDQTIACLFLVRRLSSRRLVEGRNPRVPGEVIAAAAELAAHGTPPLAILLAVEQDAELWEG